MFVLKYLGYITRPPILLTKIILLECQVVRAVRYVARSGTNQIPSGADDNLSLFASMELVPGLRWRKDIDMRGAWTR